jgi:hypothetical protein
MATIKKGILGGVSGKVGNVVGGSWKGIDYLRTMADVVTNPNTELQATQRSKFATVAKFLQPFTEVVRIGFKGYAVKMTAFNAAFSYNYHNALTGSFPDFGIDYPNALISRGSLAGTMNAGCASTAAAKVQLTWDAAAGSGSASGSDTVVFVICNPAKQEAVYRLDAATRADGSLEVSVPVNYSGDIVHCYIAFMSLNSLLGSQAKSGVSNSVYAGSVAVA